MDTRKLGFEAAPGDNPTARDAFDQRYVLGGKLVVIGVLVRVADRELTILGGPSMTYLNIAAS